MKKGPPSPSRDLSTILQTLESVSNFFDSKNSMGNKVWDISEKNILIPGRLSVIHLSSKDTTVFGAI